jgi:DNA-binding LacI/PurR family transcriptional regulator
VTRAIRKDCLRNGDGPDTFLPGERELAARYGVARVTVRRALQQLVREGYVRAEPGRGYRSLIRVAGLKPGAPGAYVIDMETEELPQLNYAMLEIISSFQRHLVEDGRQVLTVSTRGRGAREILGILRDAGAWGVAMDVASDELYQAVHASGIPCVSMDRVCRAAPVDSILQDNHGGGMAAAEHLLKKGHRRIAWFGEVGSSLHSVERFTGAQAAFIRRDRELPRELVVVPGTDDLERAAYRMLKRARRPTAVLSLWTAHTIALGAAARSLRLKIGKDLDVVGWSTVDGYRNRIERAFGPGKAPPVIVWNTDQMCQIAVSRLGWRLREPGLGSLRVSVPTRLVEEASQLKGGQVT